MARFSPAHRTLIPLGAGRQKRPASADHIVRPSGSRGICALKEKLTTQPRRRADSRAIIILIALITFAACISCSEKPPRQSVLFITIDTLRADHLGCYGYPRETSPSIDALADRSIVFENCISQATSTLPSHASIFTSLYPPAHGGIHNIAGLSKDVPSLVGVFKKGGYATGAVISNLVLESRFGLNQGFQTFDEELHSRELNRLKFRERRADAATDAAISWLQKKGGRPFFLWVHYVDPHGAYYPPPEYRRMFVDDPLYTEEEELPIGEKNFIPKTIPKYQNLFEAKNPSYYISQYDGEIRFTDDHVGRLLGFLDESGLSSDTIVVVTADHGESFTERDLYFTHTFRTYDEQAVIPLIIHFPDMETSKRVEAQVRAIDIIPTLLDRLDLENPHPVHGQSLMEVITADAPPPADFAIIYSDHGMDIFDNVMGAQRSIRTRQWKLTRNSRDGSLELYNIENDPKETNNLAAVRPKVAKQMEKLLDTKEKEIEKATILKTKLSPELIEQLNSFGYLTK